MLILAVMLTVIYFDEPYIAVADAIYLTGPVLPVMTQSSGHYGRWDGDDNKLLVCVDDSC